MIIKKFVAPAVDGLKPLPTNAVQKYHFFLVQPNIFPTFACNKVFTCHESQYEKTLGPRRSPTCISGGGTGSGIRGLQSRWPQLAARPLTAAHRGRHRGLCGGRKEMTPRIYHPFFWTSYRSRASCNESSEPMSTRRPGICHAWTVVLSTR